MIALAVTTGWAVRLWPLLRARLRTHILCSKWKKVQRIIFQYAFWENFKRAFFFVRNPACLRLLTISSISVPAGQSRHACRPLKQIWQACYMHSTNGTDQLTCFKRKSPAMLPLKELSNLSLALLRCDFHPHRTKKQNDAKQSKTPKCGGKNVRVHYGYPERILTTGL